MRIAITGATGLLGRSLTQWLAGRHDVFALSRAVADIRDAEALRCAIMRWAPDVVIHAAAIADLDICEQDPALARAVNVDGTHNVTEAARAAGAALMFISTDAVFDGEKRAPYREDDAVNPPTVYGQTKVQGERIAASVPCHWVVRIPVLFGAGRDNFVSKVIASLREGIAVVGLTDQVSGTLYTLDAARMIEQLLLRKAYGLFHLANAGACSRYELATRAAELSGLDPALVLPRTRAEWPRPAVRLAYSVMEMSALDRVGIERPRPWEEALAEYIASVEVGKADG